MILVLLNKIIQNPFAHFGVGLQIAVQILFDIAISGFGNWWQNQGVILIERVSILEQFHRFYFLFNLIKLYIL